MTAKEEEKEKGIPFDPAEFEPVSIVDRLAAALVQKILAGELAPGERIVEIGLAKQVGVGQGTVREALIQLGHRGFVTRIPGRGTYVTKLTTTEVAQIIQVRLPLEMLALELVKNVLAPDHIQFLRKALDRLAAGSKENSLNQYSLADLAFHEAIWNITGNPVLINTLRSLCSRLFAFGLARRKPDILENLSLHIDNHARIFESLIHDDLRTCQETMARHIAHYWLLEET
jgi:DNA-binding GntR family transcriptional regulator